MISLLVPSRGRPNELDRFCRSVFTTATKPQDVEVVAYVDDDDPADYEGIVHDATIIRGERVVLSQAWNICCEAADGPIYGHMGDDVIFRSPEWDDMVRYGIGYFPDHIAFVHGCDGVHNGNLGTHGFLHQRWVDTVGYFVPPLFSSDYNDTWLNEVADRIGRRVFLPSLYTEHMHPEVGKGPFDQTYYDRKKRHAEDNVDQLWADTEDGRVLDAKKLQEAIDDV